MRECSDRPLVLARLMAILAVAFSVAVTGACEPATAPETPAKAPSATDVPPPRSLTGPAARRAMEAALARAKGPNDPRFSLNDSPDAVRAASTLRPMSLEGDEDDCVPRFVYAYSWLLDHEGTGYLEQGAYSEMEGECFVEQIEHVLYASGVDREFPPHYDEQTAWNASVNYLLSERYLDCGGGTGGMIDADADHAAHSSQHSVYRVSGPVSNECDDSGWS